MRELTDKPFAVNFSFLPEISLGEQQRIWKMVELCAAERVPVIETAGGDPQPISRRSTMPAAKSSTKPPA